MIARLRPRLFSRPKSLPAVADYPLQYRQSLASEPLAEAIFRAMADAYQMSGEWSDLELSQKRAYREVATRVIQAVKPSSTERLTARVYRFCNRLAGDR